MYIYAFLLLIIKLKKLQHYICTDEVVSDFRTEKVKEGIQEIKSSAFGRSNINIIKIEDGDDDKDHRGRQFAVAVRAMLKNDSDVSTFQSSIFLYICFLDYY